MERTRLPSIRSIRPSRWSAGLLSLAALASSCGGPRLVFEDVNLRETGDPDHPIEWRATVLNDPSRPFWSLCRPGWANAVISVRAYLSWGTTADSPKIYLHGHVLTDGGDPNPTLNFPDGMAPGDRQTKRWAVSLSYLQDRIEDLGVGTTWRDYPFVFFKIVSEEPPVIGSGPKRANTRCKLWQTVQVESVADLLSKPW